MLTEINRNPFALPDHQLGENLIYAFGSYERKAKELRRICN